MNELGIIDAPQFDYIQSGNPTLDVNPSRLYATWLNITSGELFICTDPTTGLNFWQGQSGTKIWNPNFFGDNSCIAFYKMESNAEDELGVYNAEVVGTSAWDSGGVDDYCFSNANDGYIKLPFHTNSSKTISLWLNLAANTASPQFFGNFPSFHFGIYNSALAVGIGGSAYNINPFPFDIDALLGTWTHVAVAFNKITAFAEMFINGGSVGSKTGTISDEPDQPYYAMAMNDGAGGVYNISVGGLDSLRVFDRVLTIPEIGELFHEYD